MQDSLNLRSAQTTVSSFLGGFCTLAVPHFQRDYAWDKAAVSLFLGDVDQCRRKRVTAAPRPHFLGAIVTSPGEIPGTSRPHQIVIDGQQRLATVYMFLCALRTKYQETARNAAALGDAQEFADFFGARAENLIQTFEQTNDIEFKSQKSIRKLLLNKVDDPYFERLLAGQDREASRVSHHRLEQANAAIVEYLQSLFERAQDNQDAHRILETLYSVFLDDLIIVHLSAGSSSQANHIYRVLNSRGVPVSNCDLLRASTLEFASPRLDSGEIGSMEQAWDNVLSGGNLKPDDALEAAFTSRTGIHRKRHQPVDQIEEVLFSSVQGDEKATEGEAKSILQAVQQLEQDVVAIQKIAGGEICVAEHPSFTPVFKSRFEAITKVLCQEYCFPMLHAASLLNPGTFVQVADLVERFAFRYGVVVKAPIYPVSAVFEKHIQIIRETPDQFGVGDLRSDLATLVSDFAGDDVFQERLRALEYGQDNNKAIRYALVMMELMKRWFDDGAQGRPVCRDPTRVVDFKTVTLEHIEAQNAANMDPELRPFINSIGNLTIMSQGENDAVANREFAAKRAAFAQSDLAINRDISQNETWDINSFQNRRGDVVSKLLRIFQI